MRIKPSSRSHRTSTVHPVIWCVLRSIVKCQSPSPSSSSFLKCNSPQDRITATDQRTSNPGPIQRHFRLYHTVSLLCAVQRGELQRRYKREGLDTCYGIRACPSTPQKVRNYQGLYPVEPYTWLVNTSQLTAGDKSLHFTPYQRVSFQFTGEPGEIPLWSLID